MGALGSSATGIFPDFPASFLSIIRFFSSSSLLYRSAFSRFRCASTVRSTASASAVYVARSPRLPSSGGFFNLIGGGIGTPGAASPEFGAQPSIKSATVFAHGAMTPAIRSLSTAAYRTSRPPVRTTTLGYPLD